MENAKWLQVWDDIAMKDMFQAFADYGVRDIGR